MNENNDLNSILNNNNNNNNNNNKSTTIKLKIPSLEHYIHTLHYRTFDKIWEHVHENYPNATEEEVKSIIKNKFVKDPPKLNVKQYYNKIFSDHPHAWMTDILDNKGQTEIYNDKANKENKEMMKKYPHYWLIFININTRFVVVYPLIHKNEEEIFKVIKRFVSEHKCVSLTSDKESAFISKDVVKFLKEKHISQFIVLDENHTSLSIVDSFIRHLRDRNITNEKSKYQSHHSKYRNFSENRMKKLIKIYNNTTHSSTNLKPIDMENDIKLERKYIAYCLIKKSKQKDHSIPINNYVRVVLSKDVMKKRRFKVSRECYKITKRDGNNYIISAEDETSISLPRWKLIDLGSEKPSKYKFAETIPNGKYIPSSIIENNNRAGKTFLVNYGNNTTAGDIRKVEIRRHHPQIPSTIEKEYIKTTTIKIKNPNANEKITVLPSENKRKKPTIIRIPINRPPKETIIRLPIPKRKPETQKSKRIRLNKILYKSRKHKYEDDWYDPYHPTEPAPEFEPNEKDSLIKPTENKEVYKHLNPTKPRVLPTKDKEKVILKPKKNNTPHKKSTEAVVKEPKYKGIIKKRFLKDLV